MKTIPRITSLLVIAIIFINQAVAQKSSYKTNSGMTIGFGLGASYQQSDIANSRGGGFDFTMGSYIFKKENAFLSADWQFRFLAGENIAYDHRLRIDGTYNNVRLTHFNYDFELGLTLNRLKERTRIVISGFAGAGITQGITSLDLYDTNGALYDYSVINPALPRSQIVADLKKLSDGKFETQKDTRGAIMPTLGLYAGYQFSKSFSLGIEYKTNFSMSENNTVTGINIDNDIVPRSPKDRIHYTSLCFRWSLGGRSSGTVTRNTFVRENRITSYNQNINTTRPISNPNPVVTVTRPTQDIRVTQNRVDPTPPPVINKPVRMALPIIKFINPQAPLTIDKNIFELSAQTTNVKTWQDVNVTVNGISTTNFSFSNEGTVTTNIGLKEGANRVEVSGKNESGTITEKTTITFIKPVKILLPVITVLNPDASPVTTYATSQEIRARVTEVKSKENIKVSVNGTNSAGFSFDINSLLLNTPVTLIEGRNEIVITARNEAGQDVKSLVIIKETRPCPLPELKMVSPLQVNSTTDNPSFSFRAEVKNIAGRDQLSATFNDNNITNFNLTGNEVLCTATLIKGNNTWVLNARNGCGSQFISTSINYKPTEVIIEKPCLKPVLAVDVSAINQNDATHELKGTVTNVMDRRGITIAINGNPFEGFQFDSGTGELSARFRLNPGTNFIMVGSTNECGNNSKTISISVAEPCQPPQLTVSLTPADNQVSTYEMMCSVTNISGRSQISMTLNGDPYDGFRYAPNSTEIKDVIKFNPGTNIVKVTVTNDCGTDIKTVSLIVAEPCVPPKVSINVAAVTGEDATHELKGSVSNVKDKGAITVTINGNPFEGFQFDPVTGVLSAKFKLNPGSHLIKINATNDCGADTGSKTIIINEENVCGVRINPGNSSWQFCLITGSDTINRENLTNSNFNYSGPARSLFFMPVAGGGDALVNGQPYSLKSGQYYLFTGNLRVTVSTKNPGSMGQWSVCIVSDREPLSGNGNNRPKSPCEEVQEERNPKKNVTTDDNKNDSTKVAGKK
jgi:large repetitive protein